MWASGTGTPFRRFNHHLRLWSVGTDHCHRATTGGERSGGKGGNGGVWEWTSTVFDKRDGFVPSNLYPGQVLLFRREV
jgi:hypothetical protein